jgi:hypothetical protein
MTATLQEIHLNPEILDRAIAARENLDIASGGKPAATLVPVVRLSREDLNGKTEEKCFVLT